MYFSIVSIPDEHILLCSSVFLHLLLLYNSSSCFCVLYSSLSDVLTPILLHTVITGTVGSLQLLKSSVHTVCYTPFCAVSSFPWAAFTLSTSSSGLCNTLLLCCTTAFSTAPTISSSIFTTLTFYWESCHHGKRVNYTMFASLFLSFYQAPAVIINNLQSILLPVPVSRLMLVAACCQCCNVSDAPMSREMEEVYQSRLEAECKLRTATQSNAGSQNNY